MMQHKQAEPEVPAVQKPSPYRVKPHDELTEDERERIADGADRRYRKEVRRLFETRWVIE